jgi:hypothetical protein
VVGVISKLKTGPSASSWPNKKPKWGTKKNMGRPHAWCCLLSWESNEFAEAEALMHHIYNVPTSRACCIKICRGGEEILIRSICRHGYIARSGCVISWECCLKENQHFIQTGDCIKKAQSNNALDVQHMRRRLEPVRCTNQFANHKNI